MRSARPPPVFSRRGIAIMKSMYVGLFVAAAIAAGCNTHSTPGGPGATNTTKNSKLPQMGQKEGEFTLKPPSLSTSIKQGESKVIDITIARGKNFDQDVALKFEGVPEGVSIDPATPTLKHGDDKATITVKATDKAAVGDFSVKAIGHPQKGGGDASSEFKLKVSKK